MEWVLILVSFPAQILLIHSILETSNPEYSLILTHGHTMKMLTCLGELFQKLYASNGCDPSVDSSELFRTLQKNCLGKFRSICIWKLQNFSFFTEPIFYNSPAVNYLEATGFMDSRFFDKVSLYTKQVCCRLIKKHDKYCENGGLFFIWNLDYILNCCFFFLFRVYQTFQSR